MARPDNIQLFKEEPIPILYEDRSILAIDKPPGWMLVPFSWQRTQRNLQAAITSSIGAGHYWARSRNIRFLKYIHRLDAETSGILLFAKSQGALDSFGDLFEQRRMEKIYLAVTDVEPERMAWTCNLPIAPDPQQHGLMRVDKHGKEAETEFRVVASANGMHLIEARPATGRQHQIRIHMAASGCPIVADEIYGEPEDAAMGLRAVGLAFADPFSRRHVTISAPVAEFLKYFGVAPDAYRVEFRSLPTLPVRVENRPLTQKQTGRR
jgi:RluA family pseudouridine synthase